MLLNFGLKRFLLAVRNHDGTNLAATFQDSDYGSFVLAASPGDAAPALRYVHVAGLAADEGFVGFDVAAGLLDGSAMQRHPNTVIQEPCGLLSDARDPGRPRTN